MAKEVDRYRTEIGVVEKGVGRAHAVGMYVRPARFDIIPDTFVDPDAQTKLLLVVEGFGGLFETIPGRSHTPRFIVVHAREADDGKRVRTLRAVDVKKWGHLAD